MIYVLMNAFLNELREKATRVYLALCEKVISPKPDNWFCHPWQQQQQWCL